MLRSCYGVPRSWRLSARSKASRTGKHPRSGAQLLPNSRESRAEEGLALQTEAEAAFRAAGGLIYKPEGLTSCGVVALLRHRRWRGCASAADGVEATSERWAEANMHRARGELLTAVGKLAAARREFPPGYHCCAGAEREVLGTPRRDEHGAALARSGQAG